MAIARRLGDGVEPLFLTLSAAAPVVEGMGFPVEYVAAYATPGLRQRLPLVAPPARPPAGGDRRGRPGRGRLRRHPPLRGAARRAAGRRRDRGLVPAAAVEAGLEPGAARPRGRLRRGARAGRAGRVRGRRPDGRRCAIAPTGSARSSSSTAPSCSTRDEAAAELGLDPARPTILVTLGQGPEVREATRRTLARLAPAARSRSRRSPRRSPTPTRSPRASSALRATYPMSRYFAAFDGAVAAAGYNAYHELIALGVPSLFVPMPRDTDDQPARARYAEGAGIGLGVTGPADPALEAQLERLLDPGERGAIRRRARRAAAGRPAPPRPRRGCASWRCRPTGADAASGRRNPPVAAGLAGLPPPLGHASSPARPRTAVRLDAPAADQAAGAGAGARGRRSPADEVVERGRGGDRRGRGAGRGGRWWSPTRSRRSASCARSASGSSTSRRRGSRQAELAGGDVRATSCARRLELIRAERPRPRGWWSAPGWCRPSVP